LQIKAKEQCRWDLVALGEVMLRLDPGDGRIHTTRGFQVWEGGGEYNVARGLKRCFGLNTAVVTAFADNPVGRLVQDLIYQGGVDQSHVKWVKYDGVGRRVRNGLNFTERGFGVRGAVGCSDRGHTARKAPAGSTAAAFLLPCPRARRWWPVKRWKPRASTGRLFPMT
jgi:2-dehydro-3-deoxygluconokinase